MRKATWEALNLARGGHYESGRHCTDAEYTNDHTLGKNN